MLVKLAEKPKKERRRIDWHGVTFWASLAVAILLVGLAQIRPDHRIPTLLTAEGRQIFARMTRTHTPQLAKWLGTDR